MILKQDQRVKFDIYGLEGYGKIVGKVGTNDILGGTYIIEPDVSIRNDVYDYTHFVANEHQLKIDEYVELDNDFNSALGKLLSKKSNLNPTKKRF